MGLFGNLFGNKLVNDLLSTDRNEREHAIVQCIQLAKNGNPDGLNAIEDAIRKKSNKSDCQFYEPGGLVGKFAIIDAEDEIFILARSNKLMNDVPKTQLLISSIMRGNQSVNLMNQLKNIGEDRLQDFQLLGTQLQCRAIQLDRPKR